MKTSLELINMPKSTSEQRHKNSPLEITHLLRAHGYKIKWKVLSFPSYSLFTLCANRHCISFSQLIHSQKVTAPRSQVLLLLIIAVTAALDLRDPCWLATVKHNRILCRKSFLTNQGFRKEISVRRGKLHNTLRFSNPLVSETSQTFPRETLTSRYFYLSEKTSSELSLT